MRNLLFSFFLVFTLPVLAQQNLTSSGAVKIYFNHPVNTSIASAQQAIYLNNLFDDTLIAYINRAKHTIDIAVYNYSQTSQISNIYTAVNNAYGRGVRIRWIYNGNSSNTGLSLISNNIQRLGSPTTNAYGTMHNNFMIIDAKSPNIMDPIVWTGTCNWNEKEMNTDPNNVIIIQDSALANAYSVEFNEMWGDTGVTPNLTYSKFGPFKSNNTQHIFNIGGSTVECYFSPTDSTNAQIKLSLNSASDQLFFGAYSFTEQADADTIKSRVLNHSVFSAGILDQFSQTGSPYTTLNPIMGNLLKLYVQSGSVYHNCFLIADPCNLSSDPLVETGSSYWSNAADTKNDENILIIHDATVANIFYQAFDQNFLDVGGTMSTCTPAGFPDPKSEIESKIYPNPSSEILHIQTRNTSICEIKIYDVVGNLVNFTLGNDKDDVEIPVNSFLNGLYILQCSTSNGYIYDKIIVEH